MPFHTSSCDISSLITRIPSPTLYAKSSLQRSQKVPLQMISPHLLQIMISDLSASETRFWRTHFRIWCLEIPVLSLNALMVFPGLSRSHWFASSSWASSFRSHPGQIGRFIFEKSDPHLAQLLSAISSHHRPCFTESTAFSFVDSFTASG